MSAAKYLKYGPFSYFGSGGADFINAPSGQQFIQLDSATKAVEWIFQAEEAITITRLAVKYGSSSGTSPTYRVSLQGVNGSGNPDGTIKGGGSPASKTFSPSGLGWATNSVFWITLDNSYACARGEYLAMVLDYSSGTIGGLNSSSFHSAISSPKTHFPYTIHNDTGTRTNPNGMPYFGYGSSTRKYGCVVRDSGNEVAFDLNSSPDERGLKFTIPAGWCDTYTLAGLRWMVGSGLVAGGSTIITLYSGTDTTAANSTGAVTETTVQQTVTWDHDFSLKAPQDGVATILFDESSLVTLYAGATYRIVLTPQGTQDTSIWQFQLPSADDGDTLEGQQDFVGTSRVNAGNWTDTATDRYLMKLLLSDITEPSGGGGNLIVMPRRPNLLLKL